MTVVRAIVIVFVVVIVAVVVVVVFVVIVVVSCAHQAWLRTNLTLMFLRSGGPSYTIRELVAINLHRSPKTQCFTMHPGECDFSNKKIQIMMAFNIKLQHLILKQRLVGIKSMARFVDSLEGRSVGALAVTWVAVGTPKKGGLPRSVFSVGF